MILPDLMGDFETEEEPSLRPGDHSSMVIKGKRTKRPRTPSPCGGRATAAVSSSSTSGCGGGGGGDCDFSLSSDSGSTVIGSTEEEEDMAYCLILLAQAPQRRTGDEVEAENASRELFWSGMKFSKVAAAGSAATRAGFNVYECKTCNRTFPSFQALGGHRASHKKPRVAAEDTKKSSSELNSDEDGEEGKLHKIATAAPPLSSIPTFPSKLCKPKIHECSICGSGFSSGQALGGHMRRHRAVSGQVTTSLVDSVITDHHHDSRIIVERGVLSLDLNKLPAPENDSKFQFAAAAAPTQNPLLFSAPALVDCHY